MVLPASGESDESDPAMNTPPSGAAEHDSTEAVKVPRAFAPDPAACSAAQEREDERFATTGERRIARDNKAYTYPEFLQWYGTGNAMIHLYLRIVILICCNTCFTVLHLQVHACK